MLVLSNIKECDGVGKNEYQYPVVAHLKLSLKSVVRTVTESRRSYDLGRARPITFGLG